MHRYTFNDSQLRALLDADMFRADRDTAIDHVTLSDGDVYYVGGEWIDDDNAGDRKND